MASKELLIFTTKLMNLAFDFAYKSVDIIVGSRRPKFRSFDLEKTCDHELMLGLLGWSEQEPYKVQINSFLKLKWIGIKQKRIHMLVRSRDYYKDESKWEYR